MAPRMRAALEERCVTRTRENRRVAIAIDIIAGGVWYQLMGLPRTSGRWRIGLLAPTPARVVCRSPLSEVPDVKMVSPTWGTVMRSTGSRESPTDRSEKRQGRMDGTTGRAAPAGRAMTPRLFDLEGAATYLSVSPWTIRELEAKGVLPRVRVPLPGGGELRKLLFDKADLDRLIEAWKDSAG
jgi:hypothetical protein